MASKGPRPRAFPSTRPPDRAVRSNPSEIPACQITRSAAITNHTHSHDRQHPSATRRRLTAAAALVAAIAGPGSATLVDAGRSLTTRPLCYLTPAADSQPFSPALQVTTIRTHDGHIDVLHRVECPDHSVGYVWIGPDDGQPHVMMALGLADGTTVGRWH
jgi:hypothetical protein